MQIYSQFYKTDTTRVLYSLMTTKPENFRHKSWTMHCQNIWRWLPLETRATPPAHALACIGASFTRVHAPHADTCLLALWCHGWHLYDVTTHYGLARLSRPTRFDSFILTQFEPPAKRERERERECFDHVRPLTLTKKSKFSKWTCPTQFFEYIPILGSISSFETWKLRKRPIFHIHSNFGVRFVIWDSKLHK